MLFVSGKCSLKICFPGCDKIGISHYNIRFGWSELNFKPLKHHYSELFLCTCSPKINWTLSLKICLGSFSFFFFFDPSQTHGRLLLLWYQKWRKYLLISQLFVLPNYKKVARKRYIKVEILFLRTLKRKIEHQVFTQSSQMPSASTLELGSNSSVNKEMWKIIWTTWSVRGKNVLQIAARFS